MPTPGTVTLASVRTSAQQRADMVNSSFVSPTEWNGYISASYKELYDLLISSYGDDYFFADPVQFNTDGVNAFYALPDGTSTFVDGKTGASGYAAPAFYKLAGVDLMLLGSGGKQFIRLGRFNFAERNRFSPYGIQALYAYSNIRYRLNGNSVWFTPLPQSGLTMQLWYIPQPSNLVNDTDTFDGIAGWEEYVIIDAAIKALVKEEGDVSVLLAQKEAIKARIISMADDRDVGSPATVADTLGVLGGGFSPYGDPFGGM